MAVVPDPWERPLLSIEEAAEVLGHERQWGYSAARAGSLPTISVNSRLKVRTVDLYELVGLPIPAPRPA